MYNILIPDHIYNDINIEKRIELSVNNLIFNVRLHDRREFSFYYFSDTRVIRIVKVIFFSLLTCITYSPIKECKVLLTCKGGSIFSINRKISKNLPKLSRPLL